MVFRPVTDWGEYSPRDPWQSGPGETEAQTAQLKRMKPENAVSEPVEGLPIHDDEFGFSVGMQS